MNDPSSIELLQRVLEKKISKLTAEYRQILLTTPVQSECSVTGRIAVITKKVHTDNPEKADVTFYFTDEEEVVETYFYPFREVVPAPRYTLKDLPRIIEKALTEGESGKWFVSVPGTLHGKQRNKSLYSEAHFLNTVIEKRAENSHLPKETHTVKILKDGNLVEVEATVNGTSPFKAQTARKEWRKR